MAKHKSTHSIPIWRFGNRWEKLRDSKLELSERDEVPPPEEKDSREERIAQAADPVSNTLFQALLVVITFLLGYVLIGFDRKTTVRDYIFSSPENLAIICYLIMLMSFFWYLGKYYRIIWNSYYSLFESEHNDRSDFIIYAYFVAVISIFGMLTYPLIWPAYIIALFVGLCFKKYKTRKLFGEAVDHFLNQRHAVDNIDQLIASDDAAREPLWVRQLIAARQLSTSFTLNFFIWGVIVFGAIYGGTLYYCSKYPQTLGYNSYMVSSVFLVIIVVVFYALKYLRGIEQIKQQIEYGAWFSFRVLRNPLK